MPARHTYESYVLLTAARNEEKYIADTIDAVALQSLPPDKWIIVSDGSTDQTDNIVKEYEKRYPWITYLRRDKSDVKTDFASKVHALNLGYEKLKVGSYSYIGIIDADITFDCTYYEIVMSRFRENPRLGISGGYVHERHQGKFQNRVTNTPDSVAGAVQLFRRACYESVGGHRALRFGGEDTVSEMIARMKGWEVRSFPDLVVYHHNTGTKKRGLIQNAIRQGRMDYSIGTDPIFEIFRCSRRMTAKTYYVQGLFQFLGFLLSYGTKEKRIVSRDIVKFLRNEQRKKMSRFLSRNKSVEC